MPESVTRRSSLTASPLAEEPEQLEIPPRGCEGDVVGGANAVPVDSTGQRRQQLRVGSVEHLHVPIDVAVRGDHEVRPDLAVERMIDHDVVHGDAVRDERLELPPRSLPVMDTGQDREDAARRIPVPVVALRAAVDRLTRRTEDRHVVHDRLPGHAERQRQLRAGDRSMTLAPPLDDPTATARSARLRHPPEPIPPAGSGSVEVMDIVDPRNEAYMAERLKRFHDPEVLEMEAYATRGGFPIVGRNVGVTLEVLARSIGARRVMELGSGFGYSAYWFSRAVGPDGELHLTDNDPENEKKALDYLGRAGLDGPMRFHVGDAVRSFQ